MSRDVKPAKYTVTVVPNRLINNFDVLGCSIRLTEDIEVKFHRDPIINMDGTRIKANFDMYIGNGDAESERWRKMLAPHQFIDLPRYDKFTQALRLQRGIQAYEKTDHPGDHGFIPVQTWFTGLNSGNNYPPVAGKMVIKPQDGARGAGQWLVDTNFVNLQYFSAKLTDFVSDVRSNGDEVVVKEKLETFLAKFDGHVSYHSGGEHYATEGFTMLSDQGAVVQSLVPDIEHEFRLITGVDGSPVYCQRRKIRDNESKLPQATGGGFVIDHDAVMDWEDLLGSNRRHALRWLCQNVIGPMNSLDLFKTKDGGWGILEYCNQFGVSGIPQDIARDMHINYLYKVVKAYIAAEYPTFVQAE